MPSRTRLAEPLERRAAPRFRLVVPVEYANGRAGSGTIRDISASGVRIENPSMPVEIAERLLLRISCWPGSFDVELPLEVVRHTAEGGFAARFADLGESGRALLERVLPPEAWTAPGRME